MLYKFVILCMLSALIGRVQPQSNPRALNVVKLIADVLYKSPANNDFIFMVENNMMDDGIANIIEGLAPKFADRQACRKFQASSPGQLSVGPVQKRQASSGATDQLQKDVLNILDTPEGQSIIQQEVNGKLNGIPAPKYSSGGFNFNGVGKRQADGTLMQKQILSILDGAEGQHVIDNKVSGKALNIPSPRYSSAGFGLFNHLFKRAGTSHFDISSGKHGGHANAAAALLERVRNICVNKASLRLFFIALDDGTVRAAMYNVCQCNAIAKTIRNLYGRGK